MYTIIFTAEGGEDMVSGSTIGMLFNAIPLMLYTEVPFGTIIAPIFFVLVGFAALSSTISLMEVLVSTAIDKVRIGRRTATLIGAGSAFVISIFCALSLGAVPALSDWEIFGPTKEGVLSTLDHLAANWLLPIGGLFITIFVGWVLSHKICRDEIEGAEAVEVPGMAYLMFRIFIKFTALIAIVAVIIAVITGKDFS
jgi:NSS family neurotransmitter:Na+ symporter